MEIELNPKQLEFFEGDSQLECLIGGLGSGKTFVDGLLAVKFCSYEGSLGLIGSPTSNQLKYLEKELINLWSNLGLVIDKDYVINKIPPKSWGVKPYSHISNYGVITTKWGSYIHLKELYNFNSFRGSEYDWIIVDELRDVKDGALEVLIGRLRGKCYKELGLKSQLKATTTVFDNVAEIQKLQEQGFKIIQTKTIDNIDHLPVGYMELQKQILDDRTYRREVLGEHIPITSTIFYNLSEDNLSDISFNPNEDCVLSFDFNVSPMTCLVFQNNICVKEFQYFDSNTDDTTYKIADWLRSQNFKKRIEITGDPSGSARHSDSERNNYVIIKQNLKEFEVYVKTFSRERVAYGNNCVSSAIRTASGYIKLKINRSECKKLWNNLNIVTMADYQKGDPKNITHNVDALRYYCVHYLPIRLK